MPNSAPLCWLVKNPKRIPLRLVIVVPFLIEIVIAIGLTGWLSLRNGQRAVKEVTTQLRNEVTARTQEYLHSYLDESQLVNQINDQALELNLIDIQDPTLLRNYFRQQLELFDKLDSIYVSNSQGGIVSVSRSHNNQTIFTVSSGLSRGQVREYQLEGEKLGRLVKIFPQFDARESSWYQKAANSKRAAWSEFFTDYSTQNLSIASVRPFYDKSGELQGVFGSSLSIDKIQKFLNTLNVGNSGEIFIIERSGSLVSSSSQTAIFEREGVEINRIPATASNNILVSKTAELLTEEFGDLSYVRQSQQLEFTLQGQRQFVQVTPLRDERGIDWLIVVALSEGDFVAQIQENTRMAIILCLAALVVTTILGFFTTNWIISPIVSLSEASRAISGGNLAQRVKVEREDELGTLARSFNLMASQLKASFSKLEKTNEELERRVEARTRELRAAKESADAANQAKTRFLANMSHELRTPLNAILGFTQIINRDSSLKLEHQEYLQIINRSGQHLLGLINDILEMSKIEAGQISCQENTFDLYTLLNSLEDMFKLRSASKGIELLFRCSPNVTQYIYTDERKLRQVLINLLSNAIKFTEKGRVILRVKQSQNQLFFEVEDTGAGIAPEEMENLFRPFVQTATGEQSHQGTGLGLAISYQFIQLLGGEIKVSSEVNIGTIFRFYIKFKSASPAEITATQERQVIALAPGSIPHRILVVDDMLENRLLLSKLIESVGFEVRQAADGEEALAIWLSWQPHLVCIDLRMPIKNGYETIKEIRRYPEGVYTKIIVLTASAFEKERRRAFACGCDDFIAKPFSALEVLEKMARYLDINYIYQSELPQLPPPERDSQNSLAKALEVVPLEWIKQLHFAARGADEEVIRQLLQKLPHPVQSSLGQLIKDLLEDFRLDLIVQTTKKFLQN